MIRKGSFFLLVDVKRGQARFCLSLQLGGK